MVKLVIEASAEEFEAGLNTAYNKNKNKISVPGFRKGKAPRKMIEQLYGSQIFFEDAANEIIPDAYADAAKESGLDTYVERPDGSRHPVNRAFFVMVALDANNKPVEVPRLKIQTIDEQAKWDAAEKRIELRKQRRDEGF